MKSGKCVKCNSKTVYKMQDGIGSSECQYISKGGWGKSPTNFDGYLCTTCGYFENYLNNINHLDAVANSDKWKKVVNYE